jgi:hypothetical protein
MKIITPEYHRWIFMVYFEDGLYTILKLIDNTDDYHKNMKLDVLLVYNIFTYDTILFNKYIK